MPPSGTNRKSPGAPSIHRFPSYSLIAPDSRSEERWWPSSSRFRRLSHQVAMDRRTPSSVPRPRAYTPLVGDDAAEAEWRELLTGDHKEVLALRRWFRNLPSAPHCKLCYAPFGGIGGVVLKPWFGPWERNAQLCKNCMAGLIKRGIGGAEVELSLLFVDGSSATRRSGSSFQGSPGPTTRRRRSPPVGPCSRRSAEKAGPEPARSGSAAVSTPGSPTSGAWARASASPASPRSATP